MLLEAVGMRMNRLNMFECFFHHTLGLAAASAVRPRDFLQLIKVQFGLLHS